MSIRATMRQCLFSTLQLPFGRTKKGPSQRAGPVSLRRRPELFLRCIFRSVLDLASHIVRSGLGLVQLALGLHFLVVGGLADGILDCALRLVPGTLHMFL